MPLPRPPIRRRPSKQSAARNTQWGSAPARRRGILRGLQGGRTPTLIVAEHPPTAAFLAKLPPKTDMEETMLDFAPEVTSNSRLSCQIKVTHELDGLTVRMPASQH